MIRYHSFYPWHREGAYRHLMNEDDEASLRAVKSFNRELRSPLGHPFHYK
jgi:inositol oxygenase